MEPIIEQLLQSDEPAVRYKLLRNVLRKPPGSPELYQAQAQIRCCATVQKLLSEQDESGRLPVHAYQKWNGAFWVLYQLADLNYPPGDQRLVPLREQVMEWLLPNPGAPFPFRDRPTIAGKRRNCSLQEASGLYAVLALGLSDERAHLLARALIDWQWPDGGWNCDKKPEAVNSSYHESLTPLRALVFYTRTTGDPAARTAAERAADVFLKRKLFRRLSTGEVISPEFLELHYPSYWHYDVLSALKVMAEGGWISDPRCCEALDWLESRRLTGGGFPADDVYYRVTAPNMPRQPTQSSLVDWGGRRKNVANAWVTADALSVLAAAGRI